MTKIAEYPYNDYKIYKVFHNKEKRNYAILVPLDNSNKKRTTISYARYLMSVKEGRILNSWEEVDHIDNNKQNDSLDNLQILTKKQNKEKQIKTLSHQMCKLKCPNCGKIFYRRKNKTHLIKGGTYTSCSRKCSGCFSMKQKNFPDSKEVIEGIVNNIVCEFMENNS